MTPTIRTNNHWRDFTYRWDVPANVLESQFDWMRVDGKWPEDDYIDGFFQYRGIWYHTADFMRWTCPQDDNPMEKWDGYHGDSFFSGVLIKLSNDGEQYQVATYCS